MDELATDARQRSTYRTQLAVGQLIHLSHVENESTVTVKVAL